jgi:hypothetical protein
MAQAPLPHRDSGDVSAGGGSKTRPFLIGAGATVSLATRDSPVRSEMSSIRRGAAHIDVIHIRASQKLFDAGVHVSVLNVFRRD